MAGNLRNIEKSIRSAIKKGKEVKRRPGTVFSYFLMGMMTFLMGKSELNTSDDYRNDLSATKKLTLLLKERKTENREILRTSDTAIFAQMSDKNSAAAKSPWNSWQIGVDFSQNSWDYIHDTLKLVAEYPLEGILTGSGDIYDRYASLINSGYISLMKDISLSQLNYDRKMGYGCGLTQNEIISEAFIPDFISDEEREMLEKEMYEEAVRSLREKDEKIIKKMAGEIMKERYTSLSNSRILTAAWDERTDFSIGLASEEIISEDGEEKEKGLYYKIIG